MQANELLRKRIEFVLADSYKLDNLVINAKDYCLVNGLVMFDTKNHDSNFLFETTETITEKNEIMFLDLIRKSFKVIHSPIALFPTVYPKNEYDFALSIQSLFNQLIYFVSLNYEFLSNAYSSIIKLDDFSRKLFSIYQKVRSEGISQPISLSIMRNDYILDMNKLGKETMLSQIEYNTISAASGAAANQVSALHRYVLRNIDSSDLVKNQAPNQSLNGLAEGLVKAWRMYQKNEALLVFLVRKNESNIGDQRLLELKCLDLEENMKTCRLSFDDLIMNAYLAEDNRLYINGQEIGLVYFRAGYDPIDYPTEKEWNVRYLIEKSKALKCPTINYQLAGAKRVQQLLYETKIIEECLGKENEEFSKKIRATFVDQYSFENENKEKIINLMKENLDEFVLKPQREGGGNKYFGQDIEKFLSEKGKDELSSYVLMRLVKGVENENYVVKPGKKLQKQKVISEMGVFGVLIGNDGQILHNETVGCLLRSKLSEAKEGGIGIGTAVLDSLFLY